MIFGTLYAIIAVLTKKSKSIKFIVNEKVTFWKSPLQHGVYFVLMYQVSLCNPIYKAEFVILLRCG